MVPFVLTESQFVTRYRQCLDRASSRFIDSLRTLFAVNVPETIAEAEVQVFIGDDGIQSPNACIYYQGAHNKVDHADPSLFPGKSLELISLAEFVDEFHPSYYSEEFGGSHLVADTVKTWIAECWWKAGGWSYPIPAWVRVHDDWGDELSEHR